MKKVLSRQEDIDELIQGLSAVLGPSGVLLEAADGGYASAWSDIGSPLAIIRPVSTQEVAQSVKLCAAAGVPVVTWGGRTGLVGGIHADGAVAVSLDRMNSVESIDKQDATLQVQAGCILQTACEAAEAEGLLLALDLGARGSATIGGTIATNAGGNRVVRFGMMRDQVLGLEVVLADGSIVSSMRPLLKNNTGYDIKQFFIGSEGTLGIITRAILRLRPALPSRSAAMLGCESFSQVTSVLRRLESRLGGQLSAFEVMWPEYYHLVTTAPAKGRPILPAGFAYTILVESMGGDLATDGDRFEGVLGELLEQGAINDAVLSRSESDVEAMWALRDDGEQVQRLGASCNFDVSLQLSRMEQFTSELRQRLEANWPGTELVLFGHLGDGNLHVIVQVLDNTLENRRLITETVLGLVSELEGSISAEHGIGRDKRNMLSLSRSDNEIDLMRRLKVSLDPQNLLNPGKLLPQSTEHFE